MLMLYGPEVLQKHQISLGELEVVDVIPLKKISQVLNCTLNIMPSTTAQNAEDLDAFFKQAGVSNSKETSHVHDLSNNVILVFGDLLTGEQIWSLLESWSEEKMPW